MLTLDGAASWTAAIQKALMPVTPQSSATSAKAPDSVTRDATQTGHLRPGKTKMI